MSIAYLFSWVRTHNGIPVGDDGLHISVDAVTGLVTGYSLLWREDIKFPPDGPVLEANAIPAFTDLETLSVREQNYIGLAYGLGFLRGDGIGKFRPDDPVTWEELAAAVIRALPLLEGGRGW